jgi:hypothetical protein
VQFKESGTSLREQAQYHPDKNHHPRNKLFVEAQELLLVSKNGLTALPVGTIHHHQRTIRARRAVITVKQYR